jgi:hypothetical protein
MPIYIFKKIPTVLALVVLNIECFTSYSKAFLVSYPLPYDLLLMLSTFKSF